MAAPPKSKSVLQVLKEELEKTREQVEDRDRLAHEVVVLKAKCSAYDELERTNEALRRQMEEANERAESVESRVSSLKKDKLDLKEQLSTIDKTLKMKLHTIRRLEKQIKWEKRASEGQKNKVRDVERKNKMLDASAKLDRQLKDRMESDLKDQIAQVTRERALRLLQLHKHERLVRDQLDQIEAAKDLPEKVKFYQDMVEVLQREIRVMRHGLQVEQSMNDAHESELNRNTEKITQLEQKLRDLERVIRKRARENRDWRERFEQLRSKFHWMQSKLVDRLRGIKKTSEINEVMAVKAPTMPSVLDVDWGFGDGRNRDRLDSNPNYMSTTHTHQARIRGLPPQEVAQILENELEEAGEVLEKMREDLEEKTKEVSASGLRCDALEKTLGATRLQLNIKKNEKEEAEKELQKRVEMLFEVRADARKRQDVLRKRRLRQEEERNPYAAPRHLKKGWKMPHPEEAATRVQAAQRARMSRRKYLLSNEQTQQGIQIGIDKQKKIVEEFAPQIVRLENTARSMEERLNVQRTRRASVSEEVRILRAIEIPRQERILEAKAEGIHEARRQAEQAEFDHSKSLPDYLESTLHRSIGGRSTFPNGSTNPFNDNAMELLQESIKKERGWKSGGYGAPRPGPIREIPGKPLAFPSLLPPRMRRKLMDEERQAALDALVRGDYDVEYDEEEFGEEEYDDDNYDGGENDNRSTRTNTKRTQRSQRSINHSKYSALTGDLRPPPNGGFNFSKEAMSAGKAHLLLRSILAGPASPWGANEENEETEHSEQGAIGGILAQVGLGSVGLSKQNSSFSSPGLPMFGALKYKSPSKHSKKSKSRGSMSTINYEDERKSSQENGNVTSRSSRSRYSTRSTKSARSDSGNRTARSRKSMSSARTVTSKAGSARTRPQTNASVWSERSGTTVTTRISTVRSSSKASSSRRTRVKTRASMKERHDRLQRKGSNYLVSGVSKDEFIVKAGDVQKQLPVQTTGSAKTVVARIRKSIEEAKVMKEGVMETNTMNVDEKNGVKL
eukprot:g5413.t1